MNPVVLHDQAAITHAQPAERSANLVDAGHLIFFNTIGFGMLRVHISLSRMDALNTSTSLLPFIHLRVQSIDA